jgi:NADH:ubiquinone oxidoreductase subunit E
MNQHSPFNLNLDLNLVLEGCRRQPPNILQSLLALQDALGYVPPTAIPAIARALEMSAAEVAGVLSYYPDLRTTPPGSHLIRVCLGESCVANHCSRVLDAVRGHLKLDVGATTADGRLTLEGVYCLGNCAVSPTVAVDDKIYGRVTPSEVPALLHEYR